MQHKPAPRQRKEVLKSIGLALGAIAAAYGSLLTLEQLSISGIVFASMLFGLSITMIIIGIRMGSRASQVILFTAGTFTFVVFLLIVRIAFTHGRW